MAEIHRTTMSPGKLDLLAGWLPEQRWFSGAVPSSAVPSNAVPSSAVPSGAVPELAKAGGFRLDDPAGEVGIEIMIVADRSSGGAVYFVVPLSYRAAPLPGADDALIGTSEHGVLGTRWVYDGAHDPVVVAQLLALIRGEITAQHQNESFTSDPTVITRPGGQAAAIDVVRRPVPNGDVPPTGGYVQAGWTTPDGSAVHAVIIQTS